MGLNEASLGQDIPFLNRECFPVYFQKLAKSEEEDIVGNYFKQQNRASRIVAQARETKRHAGMHKGLSLVNFFLLLFTTERSLRKR